MLESVKPVIKSFQTIVKHPSSIQAPQHSFETITLKNLSKQLGESTLKISLPPFTKGDKIALRRTDQVRVACSIFLNGTDESFKARSC